MIRQDDILNEIDDLTNNESFTCSISNLPLFLPKKNPSYSIITQNIRSIYKNISDLDVNISSFQQHY